MTLPALFVPLCLSSSKSMISVFLKCKSQNKSVTVDTSIVITCLGAINRPRCFQICQSMYLEQTECDKLF